MSQTLHEFDSSMVNNLGFVFLLQRESWPSVLWHSKRHLTQHVCSRLRQNIGDGDIAACWRLSPMQWRGSSPLWLPHCPCWYNFCRMQLLPKFKLFDFLLFSWCYNLVHKIRIVFGFFLEVSNFLSCQNFLENSKRLKADTILQPNTLR